MIDTARWVIVEAWISLGLRMRWLESWEERDHARQIFTDDDAPPGARVGFVYLGRGEWGVQRPSDMRLPGYPINYMPTLSVESMRHELAHYLIATEEERTRVNFGLTNDTPSNEAEARALMAEQVIDAMLRGANRVTEAMLQRR